MMDPQRFIRPALRYKLQNGLAANCRACGSIRETRDLDTLRVRIHVAVPGTDEHIDDIDNITYCADSLRCEDKAYGIRDNIQRRNSGS